jgi:hypothetical protein
VNSELIRSLGHCFYLGNFGEKINFQAIWNGDGDPAWGDIGPAPVKRIVRNAGRRPDWLIGVAFKH